MDNAAFDTHEPTELVTLLRKTASHGWSYEDSDHQWMTPKDAAYYIDSYHREYIKRLLPEVEEVVNG